MVTVIQKQMNSGRSSRRLRPSAGDDDGRNTSAGSNEQSEHDMVAETLPRSHVARSSSRAHPPSHPGRAVAVAAKKSAELDETMDTEQLSSLSCSSSSSSSKKSIRPSDMPSPGLSPIRRKGSMDATNQSSPAVLPQGLVALPVVTRSTRRQTFASAQAPAKKEKKVLPLGESSPQSSTSSSNENNILDLFAPPQSDRARSRQSSAHAPISRATKPSSSKAEVVPGGRSQHKNRKAQDPSLSPPPPSTGGKPRLSPKTPLEPKTAADAAERKVMSTTNRKQHGSATLVHIPQSHGNDFDPFASFHKSPTWEIDAMQKSTESAPARMPVSIVLCLSSILLISCLISVPKIFREIFFSPQSSPLSSSVVTQPCNRFLDMQCQCKCKRSGAQSWMG